MQQLVPSLLHHALSKHLPLTGRQRLHVKTASRAASSPPEKGGEEELDALPVILHCQGGTFESPTPMHIRIDDLTGPEIAVLLETHLTLMRSLSPPCSVHALDLEKLRAKSVTFWTVWGGTDLMGCGAVKEIDPAHGEIKSMHTAARFRGRGVAAHLLTHILATARGRNYRRLSLETGSQDGFAPARALYAAQAFTECGPFEGYAADPNSIFMTLELGT